MQEKVLSLAWALGEVVVPEGQRAEHFAAVASLHQLAQEQWMRESLPRSVDPASEVSADWVGGKFDGAVCAPDGRIFCLPAGDGNAFVFDPSTGRTSELSLPEGRGGGYSSAVLGSDGCIYGIPANATRVLKIKPSTNTVSEIAIVEDVRPGPADTAHTLSFNSAKRCVFFWMPLLLLKAT